MALTGCIGGPQVRRGVAIAGAQALLRERNEATLPETQMR